MLLWKGARVSDTKPPLQEKWPALRRLVEFHPIAHTIRPGYNIFAHRSTNDQNCLHLRFASSVLSKAHHNTKADSSRSES